MRRLLALAAALAFLAAPLVGEAETVIQVGHKRVEPADVTISAGETVTSHNQDRMPGGHTIVADDETFSSPPLGEDESWSHTCQQSSSPSVKIGCGTDTLG